MAWKGVLGWTSYAFVCAPFLLCQTFPVIIDVWDLIPCSALVDQDSCIVTDYPPESTNFPIMMTAHYPFLHFKHGKLVRVFPTHSPSPTSDSQVLLMGIPWPTALPSPSPFNQDCLSARHDKTPPPSEVAATQHMLHIKVQWSRGSDEQSSSADLTRFTSRNGATWRVLWE